jgi:hypothetical protein
MSKSPPTTRSPLSSLLSIAAPLIGAVGVLWGIVALGRLAQDHVADNNQIDFRGIEVAPPPKMTREDFLGEVQYLARLAGEPVPDRLEPSDDLVKKLFGAFARHPWVAVVQKIERLPDDKVRIRLGFRTPVLAIDHNGWKQSVDEHGIRMPDAASTDDLPVLRHLKGPRGPAGTLWGDDRVTATARTAAYLHDSQEKLALTEIVWDAEEMVLTTKSGGKIVWGHAPGDETANEASAESKRKCLMERATIPEKLDVRKCGEER